MEGRVYSIVRPGHHDDLSHPNAVIVKLATDSYLCVAGFTPGKEKYQRAKSAEFKLGIWGPAFAVEIDHLKHLAPVDPKLKLHVCGYVCQTAELMTTTQLRAGKEWGPLSADAIRDIAAGLLARESIRSFLPKKAIPLLKAML